jgi:hypothetical protein
MERPSQHGGDRAVRDRVTSIALVILSQFIDRRLASTDRWTRRRHGAVILRHLATCTALRPTRSQLKAHLRWG